MAQPNRGPHLPFSLQEEMKTWLTALSTSISEHNEIARWSQALLTTSSTDEGNPKRDPDRRASASGRRK